MFDVLNRVTELRNERGWSVYRLAKNANIPQSSMATWFGRGIVPPTDAIEKMCIAFGITLSEFFEEKSADNLETKLAKYRKNEGLSQEELAEKAEISVETICAYEQGKRDISRAQYRIVKKLADVLSCKPEDIAEN